MAEEMGFSSTGSLLYDLIMFNLDNEKEQEHFLATPKSNRKLPTDKVVENLY